MDKILLIIFIICIGTSISYANEDKIKACTLISELAKTIMTARQSGVLMSELVGIADEESPAIFIKMVIIAYDEPRYQSEKYIQEAITEFQNLWFSVCIRSLD